MASLVPNVLLHGDRKSHKWDLRYDGSQCGNRGLVSPAVQVAVFANAMQQADENFLYELRAGSYGCRYMSRDSKK
jgi:hypothetical protein